MSTRMAAMAAESIRVTRSVTLPLSDIELRFSRSSGPGGQHAQRPSRGSRPCSTSRDDGAHTRQRSARSRRRARSRAVAQDERSQWRNRELAVERLVERAARGAQGGAAARPTPHRRLRASGGSSRTPPGREEATAPTPDVKSV